MYPYNAKYFYGREDLLSERAPSPHLETGIQQGSPVLRISVKPSLPALGPHADRPRIGVRGRPRPMRSLAAAPCRRGLRVGFRMTVLLTLVIGMSQLNAQSDQGSDDFRLLPSEIAGWSASGKDHVFSRKTIFDYMNGGGEVYLAYDFQQLSVREYTRASEPPVLAEVYRMGSSKDAYGVFTNDLDGDSVELGQGTLYGEGLLRFWKGRFFIRLMAGKETSNTKTVLMELGRKIVDAIGVPGALPDILSYLPAEGLVRGRTHFFHTQGTLNFLYYVADANLLHLSEHTDAVLARYEIADRKVRLLMVCYPTAEAAKGAHGEFCRAYFPDRPQSEAAMRIEKVENDEFVSARWVDGCMILVFEAGTAETCSRLTDAVERLIKEGHK